MVSFNRVVWLCLLSVLSVICTQVSFQPTRMSIVDKRKGNYLIRGNIPLVNGTFRMDLLHSRIQQLTNLKPNSYQLKVISLMNHYTEKESNNLLIEESYFHDHPEAGEYMSYPVLGFVANPQTLPQIFVDMIAYFYEKFSFDKLDHFSEELYNYIAADNSKPVVYYFHCSHGVDRTGLVSGVYKMKYQNKSLKEVVDQNFSVGQRDMLWTTYYGLLWYCEHLQRDRKTIDCGEQGGDYYISKQSRQLNETKRGFDDEL